MNLTKILTFFVLLMVLIPSVYAGDTKTAGDAKDNGKVTPTDAKNITDNTKEKATKITNKDKSISGDITVTTKDVTKYHVNKKSSTEISITKKEAKGEHTKSKVTIPKSELSKIDIDKDKIFGCLWIGDNGEVWHTTYTESELVSGVEMVFSTNIVNGYSGHKQYTFNSVTSGQTLNIDDVSGNYSIAVAVDGTVPTYTAGIPTDGLWAHYTFDGNANDSSGNGNHGTAHNVTYGSNYANFNGIDGYISIPDTDLNNSFTVVSDMDYTRTNGFIFSQGHTWSSNGTDVTGDAIFVADADTAAQGFGSRNIVTGRYTYGFEYNSSHVIRYKNTIVDYVETVSDVPFIGVMESNARIASREGVGAEFIGMGKIYDMLIYSRSLSTSELEQAYAGGSGISFQPEPSYNWTGYNIPSGTEKLLDTDATCTQIEVVNTAGTTLDSVTVTVYFTEDYTSVTQDVSSNGISWTNITKTFLHNTSTGTMFSEVRQADYYGTPVLYTNDTTTSVTKNDTHVIITCGPNAIGTSKYYRVGVPKYLTSGKFIKTGTSQNASTSLTLGVSKPSNVTSAVSLNISTTAYSDPYTKILETNPAFWCTFDENNGTNVVEQVSGLNGTILNTYSRQSGKYNNAVRLSEDISKIQYPANNIFNITGNKTLVYSLKLPNTINTDWNEIFSKDNDATNGYRMQIYSNGLLFFMHYTTGDSLVLQPAYYINDGNWHTLLIEIDTTNKIGNMYIDNTLRASDTYSGELFHATDLYLTGSSYDSVDVIIDTHLIYNNLLSPSTRTKLHFDGLQQLQAKTNANSTYSGYWNSSSNNPLTLPVSSLDGLISSIQFKVPVNITQNGVNIYYYNQTAAPFTPTVTMDLSNTGDLTHITESTNSTHWNLNVVNGAGETYTDQLLTYALPYGVRGTPTLSSNNTLATVTSNNTHVIIDTGAVSYGTSYYYNIAVPKYTTGGHYKKTFYNVTSGQMLNVSEITNFTRMTAKVSGTVPEYTAIEEDNVSTYPRNDKLIAAYSFNNDATDLTGNRYDGVSTNVSYTSDMAVLNGIDSVITVPRYTGIGENITINLHATMSANETDHVDLLSKHSYENYRIGYDGGNKYVTSIKTAGGYNDLSFVYPDLDMYMSLVFIPNETMSFYGNGVLQSSIVPHSGNIINTPGQDVFYGISPISGVYAKCNLWSASIYNVSLTDSELKTIYAGGSGISFQPEPSYNFTGYDVTTGTEKLLNTDATCNQIEVVNTAGTTLPSVTINATLSTTGDTYDVTESMNDTVWSMNMSHTPSFSYSDHQIVYAIPTGYAGTPTLTSSNNDATISNNVTHFVIETGALTSGEQDWYEVSILKENNSFIKAAGAFAVATFAVMTFVGIWRRKR